MSQFKHRLRQKQFFTSLRLSGMNRIECWTSANISTNSTVDIFRVNVFYGVYEVLPYMYHAVGGDDTK